MKCDEGVVFGGMVSKNGDFCSGQLHRIFTCMLLMAVMRSCSDGVVIHNVLSVKSNQIYLCDTENNK